MTTIAQFRMIEELEKFHFVFTNSEESSLFKSILYSSKKDCVEAMIQVKKFGASEDHYLRMRSPDSKYYFMLRDDELRELGSCSFSDSMSERNRLITECIRFCKSAAFNPMHSF